MSHPVLFAIDDDPGVVRALRDDLGRRFGEDFRVIGTSSAAAGLAMLGELADEHVTVAVLIVGHQMREMPGAEFLAEWAKNRSAAFELFHVIGRLDGRSTNELRELLIRFNVPFRFDPADSAEGRRLLEQKGLQATRLPVVIRHDDYTIVEPTSAQIVEAVGGSTHNDVDNCDVVIVGAGPAGLTALDLARRARQVTMLVRGDNLARSMAEYLIREIEVTPNLTVRLNTEVTDGHGIEHLDALTLHDVLQDRSEQVPATALFILIGGVPRTQWLPGTVQTDHGYILTGRDVVRDGVAGAGWLLDRAPLPLETSLPGVFAVGDARYRSLKRVASAVGDGGHRGAARARIPGRYYEGTCGLMAGRITRNTGTRALLPHRP